MKDINAIEIFKLGNMLEEANIPYKIEDISCMLTGSPAYKITLYQNHDYKYSLDDAIFYRGSRGFEEGLLETYILNGCKGFETSEEVFKGWKELYNYFKTK